MKIFKALYQHSFDSRPKEDCLTGCLETAQENVHFRYRSIVPEGHDTEFTFQVITRKGFKGFPLWNLKPDDVVIEFEGAEGGQCGWVECSELDVRKELSLVSPNTKTVH